MSAIILTVDTPVLKGEKGDKGETGSFDYGELERIVELNLGDKLEKINKSLEGKVNTDESHSMVDNNVIATFGGLEKWVDNPFITKDENGEPIEEARTIVKMFDTKVDNTDLDIKVEEAKGELQTYIDENLEASKSGDMLRSVYDKDRDGVVDLAKQADNASTVNGKTVETSVPENAIFTDTTYGEAAADKAGLMSAGDKVKLNGIASGATRVEIIDSLDSTDISKALSANQGKALGDNVNTINTNMTDLSERVGNNENSITIINNKIIDTGWVTLTPESGWSIIKTLQARRFGPFVQLSGTMTYKSEITTSNVITITTLPSQFVPAVSSPYPVSCSGNRVARVYIGPSGRVHVEGITSTLPVGAFITLTSINYLVG